MSRTLAEIARVYAKNGLVDCEEVSCPYCWPHAAGWVDRKYREFHCTHCGAHLSWEEFRASVTQRAADYARTCASLLAMTNGRQFGVSEEHLS